MPNNPAEGLGGSNQGAGGDNTPAFILPQDSFGAYDFAETKFTLTSLTVGTQVAIVDPSRVVVAFYAITNNAWVALLPLVTNNSYGILVQPGQPVILSHSMMGPLVSQRWFACAAVNPAPILVQELFLRRPICAPKGLGQSYGSPEISLPSRFQMLQHPFAARMPSDTDYG